MLKHGKYHNQSYICTFTLVLLILPVGRAGVPMEVMGLMLGEFVDDYTVRVIDVFAMPQSGTVSMYINPLTTIILIYYIV